MGLKTWKHAPRGKVLKSNVSIAKNYLNDKSKVSMLEARLKAEQEYDKYLVIQDKEWESDFAKEIKRLGGK